MNVHEWVGVHANGNFPEVSQQAMVEALANRRLHQIELEMQNEELRRTQAALEIANSRYFDFYDLAPVGYVTVSAQAVIQEANLTTASLLGVPRAILLGKLLPSFVFPADADSYDLLCKKTLANVGAKTYAELRFCQPDGQLFWVSLQAFAVLGDDGVPLLRLVLSDITQRIQRERAAIEASESKFRLVADNTLDGIVVFGADKHIQYVSPACTKLFGYSEADQLKQSLSSVLEWVHPQDRDALFASLQRAVLSKDGDVLYAYRFKHRLGHYIWREDSVRLQYDAQGHFSGACVVARDITQRRKVEEVLRIAATAFETQEPMVISDVNSVILMVNRAFTSHTGYSAEEAVGQSHRFLRSGRHDDEFYHQLWDAVRQTGRWEGEVWDRHKDGAIVPKWVTITAVKGFDGGVSYYVGSSSDLSERKRAEAALLKMNHALTQSRQQLRQLVALNEARLEQEKRHIAREVHDELGQVLTALRMDLSLTIIRYAKHVPELAAKLSGMKTLVDRAIQAVRNVASSLRPAALDLGLVSSIAWLCQEFARHGDVACTLNAPDAPVEMDASRNVVVFRIVQESLTNIRKHAQASQVAVALVWRGHELLLDICDNGCGFDPALVAQQGSLGLVGMRERVISLGGQIDISSAPGRGTLIAVVIPLDPLMAREFK